jgi:hypothetical protein
MAKPSHNSKFRAFRFERHHDQLAPRSVFFKRVAASFLIAFGLIGFALMIGIMGYHTLAGFGWVDSLLEASMILGGMGPVNPLTNDASKIFASIYALFSGLMFIGIMGVVLSPIVHRFLHKFHVDE